MKKLTSLFALLCASVMMFAETATMQYTGSTSGNMKADENNAASVGLDASLFEVNADKGTNSNFPGLNKAGQIRLYQANNDGATTGNTIEIVILDGTITSATVNLATPGASVTNVNNDGLTVLVNDVAVASEDYVYPVNATSFKIQNCNTTKSMQVWISSVDIEYVTEAIETTEISLSDVTVKVGKTAQVTVTANGNSPLTWSIADEAIATVNDKGVVTGVAVGTTTVTAKVGETLSATATVTVEEGAALPAEGSSLTCAEAQAAALLLEKDQTINNITVTGYVVTLKPNKNGDDISNNQQSVEMADEADATSTFISYWGNCPKDENGNNIKLNLGDEVSVTGALVLYNGKGEIKNGTVTVITGGEVVIVEPDPVLTPSEAAAEALKLNRERGTSTTTYTIEGWVVDIETPFDAQYKNESLVLGDTEDGEGVLVVFRATPASGEATPIGSKVSLTGAKLQNYYDVAEVAQGATVTVLEKGNGGTDPKPTKVLTIAEAAEITSALAENATSSTAYTLEGYVVAIQGTNKGYLNYWLDDDAEGDRVIMLYGGKTSEDILLGAKIRVENVKLQNYKGTTLETTSGGVVTLIEQGEGEEILTPSEAFELAMELQNDGSTTYVHSYTIAGYVSGIKDEWGASTDYPNSVSFWMSDEYDESLEWGDHAKEFQVYNGYSTEDVQFGDYVVVEHASLINYKGTPETSMNARVKHEDEPITALQAVAQEMGLTVIDGAIRVQANAQVQVYTVAGQLLYNAQVNGEATIPVDANVVIVRVADKAVKVMF